MTRSLRTKLQLLSLILVIVPGALFAVQAVVRTRSALERAVGGQLAQVAHDVVEEVLAALVEERSRFDVWARQDVMRDLIVGDVDKRITRFLLSVRDDGARYRDLACLDAAGRVVASTEPAAIGRRVAEPWAQQALAGQPTIGAPVGDGAGVTLRITVPVFDPDGSGRVTGALTGHYNWRHAMGLVDRVRQTLLPHGLGVDVALIDGSGTVVGEAWRTETPPALRQAVRALAAASARRVLSGEGRGWFVEGEPALLVGYARARADRYPLAALVAQPTREALAPIHMLERQLAIGFVLVALVALGIATYVAARMIRPLRELTAATRALTRAGEPSLPVAVRSHDEIGELAASFNVMTAALADARQDLLAAAKFAFVGEVAAGVAHEIRTPLGILRSSAQMLQRSVPPGDAQAAELAGMMVEEVDRLDRVVDGLLELARPHEPAIADTPLAPVLGRALDFAAGRASEKGIALRRALAAEPLVARCDGEQIYQVVLNLLVNALQVLPAGGAVEVRSMRARPGRVAFEVEDDGPGIAPEDCARVFTPFFSARPGGTGLGLTLVQRVVQAHHGSVAVQSTLGRGTTFRVELPEAGGGVAA